MGPWRRRGGGSGTGRGRARGWPVATWRGTVWCLAVMLLLLLGVVSRAGAGVTGVDFSSSDVGGRGQQQQEETASAELEDYIHGLEEASNTANSSMYKKSRSIHPPASHEKRLTKYLLSNYRKVGRGGRPVSNSSTPVLVKFGLAMIQMGLDEKDNMLTTSVWCRYRWHDEYLTWEPKEFGGVHTIRLSSGKIWIPDIMLYNTADTHKMERDVLVVIEHNGDVLWIPHRLYRASCGIDVTNYPFDTQTCDMTFGSWAYHGNEIDLGFYEDMEMLDISDLERESTEWDIIAKGENRKSSYYDCCKDPYVTLTFTLSMRRKLVFSSFILTLPCIFLACMTLVVFWLPPERPDRIGLAMSLFASFLLLLLILVEAAPPTATSVPTLGLYYCFNMTLIMLSIFLSSIVVNINRKGDSMKAVPKWLKVLTGRCFKNVSCFSCPRSRSSRVKVKEHQSHRHSKREAVVDAEDGVITNQEALQVNNSSATALQVEATLTSSNGVQTNVVPASQPLLSRNNSGDEGSDDMLDTEQNVRQDMQVTCSNRAGDEEEQEEEAASHRKSSNNKATTAARTTDMDNLSTSSAAGMLTESENTQPLLVPKEADKHHHDNRSICSSSMGGLSGPGNNDNTTSANNGSRIQQLEKKMDAAMYAYLFRSLNNRLATLERHLANTERGIQEVVGALAVKDITLRKRELQKEWKFIASTLDMVFFLFFIVSIGVSLGTLFPRPYQLQIL